jgi:phosphoketolase
VTDLMILAQSGSHPHSLSDEAFDVLFTRDRPIHFNYHGYPIELQGLLFGRPNLHRMTIEGSVAALPISSYSDCYADIVRRVQLLLRLTSV